MVADFFGSTDPAKVQIAIEGKRLRGSVLTRVREDLNLGKKQLAPILAIEERTLARRESSREALPLAEADRLYRLVRIVDLATQMFADEKKAADWLRQPLPALGGATPLEMLTTEPGTRRVEQVLYSVGYGGVT